MSFLPTAKPSAFADLVYETARSALSGTAILEASQLVILERGNRIDVLLIFYRPLDDVTTLSHFVVNPTTSLHVIRRQAVAMGKALRSVVVKF